MSRTDIGSTLRCLDSASGRDGFRSIGAAVNNPRLGDQQPGKSTGERVMAYIVARQPALARRSPATSLTNSTERSSPYASNCFILFEQLLTSRLKRCKHWRSGAN